MSDSLLLEFQCSQHQIPNFLPQIISYLNYKQQVLCLIGDLGSGKTTFTQLLLKNLNVDSPVSSPTFNLVNEYKSNDGLSIAHFDLYRIENIEELNEIGFYEYIENHHLTIIEWPEKIINSLNKQDLILKIEHENQIRKYKLFVVN